MFLPLTDGVVIIINSLKIAQGVEKIHDICTQTSLPFYRFSNVTGFWLYGHIKIPPFATLYAKNKHLDSEFPKGVI